MQLSTTSVTRVILLAVAVFFFSLGPSAKASDRLNTCVSSKSGKLSKIYLNATPRCGSTAISLNVNDAVSPTCAPQRFHEFNLPGGAYSLLNATCCPAEDIATGAGGVWETPFERADNGPFYFFPTSGNTWTVRAYNQTASTQDYDLVVQCCGRQAVCGDGITECSEQCDPPGNTSQCSFSGFPTTCGSDCRCPIP
jgi:hypothetical protein